MDGCREARRASAANYRCQICHEFGHWSFHCNSIGKPSAKKRKLNSGKILCFIPTQKTHPSNPSTILSQILMNFPIFSDFTNSTAAQQKHTMDKVTFDILPSLILSSIFGFLTHKDLLSLALTNQSLKRRVAYDLSNRKDLWRVIRIQARMSDSKLLSLRKALHRKVQYVNTIIVQAGQDLDGSEILLSQATFDFISTFHDLKGLEIKSKVSVPHVLRILSVFQNYEEIVKCRYCGACFGRNLQFVKLSMLNIYTKRIHCWTAPAKWIPI